MKRFNNNAHLLLALALMSISLSLYTPVMGWIQILVICSVIMRVSLNLGLQKHAPSLRTINLLAVLSGLVLAYFSWHLGALLAMINLLMMACALKLMLLRGNRDYYQLIASAVFLVGCGFIFEQSIGFTLIYIVIVSLLLLSLLFNTSPSLTLKKQSSHILIMSLQALPIALLVFFVMPKLSPFWQMPTNKSAETGLSDTLTPGDIANLSQSTDLAFRVTFDNAIPEASQRYWRAITLEEFDGKTWQVAKKRLQFRTNNWRTRNEFSPDLDGLYYDYQVMAKASNQRWLFALDIAIPQGSQSNSDIWQSHDYQLLSKQPLISNFQYDVRSYTQADLNYSWKKFDQQTNLQVALGTNPRTEEWARQLSARFSDKAQLIDHVMNYFNQQEFRYTLQPNAMLSQPVDTFLFDEKAGFCSHYASAMAYVLRLAGIPARVIAGYQGGELRETDYLSVYQYDAHAWVEAWFDEKGWQRFDPTAVVAPDRISFGLEQAVAEEGSFLVDSPFSLARLKSIAWLNSVRLSLADMDYLWSRWILGFDSKTQRDLFKGIIGELTPYKLAMLGLSIVVIIILLLVLFYLPNWQHSKLDPIAKIYHSGLNRLAKNRIYRLPWQGPQAFREHVEQSTDVTISAPFAVLSEIYMSHNYGREQRNNEKQKGKMIKALKQLKRALNHSS
jgi:transglutaminase-like putative cysteine protease